MHHSSTSQRGILFIEVRVDKTVQNNPASVEGFVRKRLRMYQELRIGQCVDLSPLDLPGIESIEVTGHTQSREFPDHSPHRLEQNDMEITVYSLFRFDGLDACAHRDNESASSLFKTLDLPHETFEGLWSVLTYEKPVKELCLRALTSAIDERRETYPAWSTDPWQNTVLLCGPPGSGKTTLAQAISQRLSIRYFNRYNGTQLLQIHTPALLSHLWGETVKRIGELFQLIIASARQEEPPLLIVILDEVETFAACREKSYKTEPSDATKATAEMLRGLDDCRKYENVVFMFTSNFINALDAAFLDRMRIKKKIDLPNANCVFEILRKEINSLIEQGFIVIDTLVYDEDEEPRHDDLPLQNVAPSQVPTLDWARSNWPPRTKTAVSELARIAATTQGLSPRSAKSLLALARHEYLVEKPAKLRDTLDALEKVLREEMDEEPKEYRAENATLHTPRTEEQDIADLVSDLLSACQPQCNNVGLSVEGHKGNL